MSARLGVGLLFVLCLATPVHVGAQETGGVDAVDGDPFQQAQLHYEDAVLLYEAQEFLGAAQALERAYGLDPNPILAYNIARAYDDAGEFESATTWYQTALATDDLGESERKRAEFSMERIANTKARLDDEVDAVKADAISRLQVTSSAPDARVFIDDALVGNTPFALVVEPGPYAIRVEADGYEPYIETVSVARSASVVVRAALDSESMMPWVYGLGGASLAALGVGIAGDVLAIQAYDDAKAARGDSVRVASLKSDGETFRIMAVTGYSVAGIAAISGLVVLLVDLSGETGGNYGTFGARDWSLAVSPEGAALTFTW